MMGYQRAADEQAARQMERGRQIAAGLGGGAGLAYMQGVSSNVAAQERQGLLGDMSMQARNRAELDQLINMRNQEMQQQRAMEGMEYQLGMQDYIRQREGLEADIAQQGANIGAAIGSSVADIPAYVQNFRMYNALKGLPSTTTPPQATTNRVLEVPEFAPESVSPYEAMMSRINTPKFPTSRGIMDPRYSMSMGIMPRFYRPYGR